MAASFKNEEIKRAGKYTKGRDVKVTILQTHCKVGSMISFYADRIPLEL